MKALLMATAFVALTACAASPLQVAVPDIAESDSVKLTDLRPGSEAEKETFSLLISSDAYAIYRVGDAATVPPPLRLLQHQAYEQIPSNGAPLDITVYHFVSYMNAQSSLRAGAIGGIFGPIGGGIAMAVQNQNANFNVIEIDRDKFDSIPSDQEYTRAYYSATENPDDAIVFVIYLDAEINGKRRIIRSVSPSETDDGAQPFVAALTKTIDAFLSDFSTQ